MIRTERYRDPTYLFALAGFLACVGDFAVTFILGALYPGYNFIDRTESYLGASGSPVAMYMNVWGVVFFLLLMVFAFGLRRTIFKNGSWEAIAAWCVLLYGLGEGAGSGLFPYDHANGMLTSSAKLHSVFGGIAGLAIVFLPFASTKIFLKEKSPAIHAYCRVVFFSGLILIIVFLISKGDLIPFKGLWQRLFILDYHIFISVLAVMMIKAGGGTLKSPEIAEGNQ
ncbi:MAG TPA: DUF998 domain-containing protein [Cyclobacteriaceae bacterium]|nr:DUF998 domain-containing protein [Cyclobacteriaceae bacterium]